MATESPVDLSATLQPNVYAAGIITYVVAFTAVVLRFVARRLKKLRWWLDDWFILVALISATGYLIDAFVWIKFGLGLHYQALNVKYSRVVYTSLLQLVIEETLWSITVAFVKLSILSFYWRIFNVLSIRLPIRILAVAVVGWLIGRLVAIFMHCIPLRGYWDKSVEAHCGVNDRLFFLGTNTTHLLIDIILLILPIPYIRKLFINRPQKVVLCGIFLLGGFVCIVSLILIVECVKLDVTSRDITWNFAPIVMWAGVEHNLAIVSACLPSLRPIYLLVSNRLRTEHSRRPSKTTNNSSNLSSHKSRVFHRTTKTSRGGADTDSTRNMTVTNDELGAMHPHEARWDRVSGRTDVMGGAHAIPLAKMDGILVKNEVHVDMCGKRSEERELEKEMRDE